MGVNLSSLLEPRETTVEGLLDKKIAVDAFNWIYQFLSTIRQRDGEPLKDSSGRVTSHLSGLFYRNLKLMGAGVKLVYVFDGPKPDLKSEESQRRRAARKDAREKWKAAQKTGDIETAEKYAKRSSEINEEIIQGSKQLLEKMGIPVVQAPSEGEAQCSYICSQGQVWAVASQDFDSLLFGATRLVRNLSISGKKKRGNEYVTVNPEMLVLEKQLQNLGINRDQLIIAGILMGTDYSKGVKGYGPKKSLELVKEKKHLDMVLEEVDWTSSSDPKKIFQLFKNPKTKDVELNFRDLDREAVKQMLCDEHDFSEKRVDSALDKVAGKSNQKSLSSWTS